MKNALRKEYIFFFLLAALAAFYVLGIKSVPFHPDESTQLFMSADFEQFLKNYKDLAWTPERSQDLRMRYRLLDAPITRDLLSLGLALGSRQPPRRDWDWSKSWEENRTAGALPEDQTLVLARSILACLFPFTLAFFYFSVKSILGRSGGLFAVLLLGMNPLFLLHTRRAMAEAALVFGVTFFLWTLTRDKMRPWSVGLALALAINAKQSALPLLLPGLLAVIFPAIHAPIRPIKKLKQSCRNACQMFAVLFFLTLALNPVYWKYPMQASQEAIALRKDLLERQVSDRTRVAPKQVLDGVGIRSLGLLANLYVTPPAFAEVGNYLEETEASQSAYLAMPGNSLGRSLVGGGLLFGLTLLGLIWAIRYFQQIKLARRRKLALLALATISQASGLLALPLPWQRYVIPLLPFVCAWAAAGLNWGWVLIQIKSLPEIGTSGRRTFDT